MRLALLSAAVEGDNSGDAIIESAVRRLLATDDVIRYPLTAPLNDGDIEGINSCDALVICGTNLYQQVFACNLTTEIIERIRIPIIPFGVGSSAPIGRVPKMNAAGVAAVRAIHRKCVLSSVRDEASLRFLHSIGVRNVLLTGCPVLFHNLSCPDFTPAGEGYTLTPRARLLHIDEKWGGRQLETLELLCRTYHPTLILQSPYDIPVAERLAGKYGVDILHDAEWQAEAYIGKAREQYMNFGFRLHFAMLSIAYGKPAFVIAHDSRVSEFCRLLGLPHFDIRDYSDNLLRLQIDAKSFNADGVRWRWDELSVQMSRFMAANGIETRLSVTAASPNVPVVRQSQKKPRILLLADKRNWAFDNSAREIATVLKMDFHFDREYVQENPRLDASRFDLLHLFFWGETYYRQFGFNPERVMKELSSHRWEDDPRYGPCSPAELVVRYFDHCASVICTSVRLKEVVNCLHPRSYHTPNGYTPRRFRLKLERAGAMTVGWAGNAEDPVKGFRDILEPACRGRFNLLTAPGNISHRRMNDFYNRVDVLAVTSRHEGEPLTLIEAMAAGCFPVCGDVGIVPELIRHRENGFIVPELTTEAFAHAFTWCEENLDHIRRAGMANACFMARERNWEVCAYYFKWAYVETIAAASRPRFRNDDVSWDTSLVNFRRFCEIFHRYGLKQVHGVVLRGCTNTLSLYDEAPVEYEGRDTIAKLDNGTIRELSRGKDIEKRHELVAFLNSIPDEIALHGFYHVDFSQMTYHEQMRDVTAGLDLLRRLFPTKRIRYFIPPFNRVNRDTYLICKEMGLEVLTTTGVHLEAELDNVILQPSTWYRYHHHRFYPESAFDYYRLSLEQLESMLARNISTQPRDLRLYPANGSGYGASSFLSAFLAKFKL